MSLPIFPNIQQPSYPFGNQWEDPALTSKMENGFVVSRPKFTWLRETFNLKWEALPAGDLQALRAFWRNEALGGSHKFLWTYPIVPNDPYSEKQFIVRFANSEPRFELVAPGIYSGELTLQEVEYVS